MLNHLKNRTVYLYAGMLVNVILGYLVTKINTAYLSVEAFGVYSLFINFILFTRVFFSFGIFESSSRIIAAQKDVRDSRQLLGTTLLITLILGVILSFFIFASSFMVDAIFEIKISFLLRLLWFFTFALLFQILLQVALRGLGNIKQLSIYYFTPRLIYLCLMGLLLYYGVFTLTNTAGAFLISIVLTVIVFIFLAKPVFRNIKIRIKQIKDEVLSYGRHLYVANIFSAFFLHIDKLFLAYFLDARQLGYYALAFTISAPLPYFSTALSTSAFREFAETDRITFRKLAINTIYVVTASILLLLFNGFIVETLFSSAFAPARPALYILTIAFSFSALSIPYTLFFKAQKLGREIRNITMATQIVFLISNLILIPIIGIRGAAIASLLSYGLDYLLYVMFYNRRVLKTG